MCNNFSFELNEEIKIEGKDFFSNTLIVGDTKIDVESSIFYKMASQIILNRHIGATFVVTSKDTSMNIYAMAKKNNRRVLMLSPTYSEAMKLALINNATEFFLNTINFTNYIYNRYIVIIDIEYLKNLDTGLDLAGMILKKLESDMIKIDKTYETPHILFIDDSHLYIKYIENILYYGSNYNIGTNLFIQSLGFLEKDCYMKTLALSSVSNHILSRNCSLNDRLFYYDFLGEKFERTFNESDLFIDSNLDLKSGNISLSKKECQLYKDAKSGLKTIKRALVQKRERDKKKIPKDIVENIYTPIDITVASKPTVEEKNIEIIREAETNTAEAVQSIKALPNKVNESKRVEVLIDKKDLMKDDNVTISEESSESVDKTNTKKDTNKSKSLVNESKDEVNMNNIEKHPVKELGEQSEKKEVFVPEKKKSATRNIGFEDLVKMVNSSNLNQEVNNKENKLEISNQKNEFNNEKQPVVSGGEVAKTSSNNSNIIYFNNPGDREELNYDYFMEDDDDFIY